MIGLCLLIYFIIEGIINIVVMKIMLKERKVNNYVKRN